MTALFTLATRSFGALALVLALNACAQTGDPNMTEKELTGTHWWVEDILGGGVIDRSHTTVNFIEDGRVAGDTACNRYTGGYEQNGGQLTFGALAGTRRACPESIMNQEQRFYQAIGQVRRFRIDERTGHLHLIDENGATVIRAARITEGQEAED